MVQGLGPGVACRAQTLNWRSGDHTKGALRDWALSSMKTLNYLFLGIFLAFLIAGCQTLGPLDAGLDADFRLRGKIGVRGADSSDGAFSASFDWVQAGDAYRIELWGPFGQGRVRLAGDPTGVTITDARGRTLSDAPEALMEQELGWSAPVDALRHWVRGNPAPDHPATASEHGENGRLARFGQRGWIVELSRWRTDDADEVPGRVVATRNGRRVTVVCKEWL